MIRILILLCKQKHGFISLNLSISVFDFGLHLPQISRRFKKVMQNLAKTLMDNFVDKSFLLPIIEELHALFIIARRNLFRCTKKIDEILNSTIP